MGKKKNKFKKYIIISIIAIVLIVGYVYINSNAKKAMKDIASSYVVESVAKKETIQTKLSGSGVIQPLTRVEIPKSVTGEVKTANYKEGDNVKKDATLFKIENMSIKAPIEGTLVTKNAEKGDYVMQQTATVTSMEQQNEPLAVIADISKMKVILEVDEVDIAKVKLGMKADITCDAVDGKTYEGEVSKIAAEGKNGNGVTTYDVTIQIQNTEDLKIGMNADIAMIVEEKQNVLKIPMDAINKEGNETYVYIKDDNAQGDEKEKVSFKVPSSMAEVKGYKKQVVTTGLNNKDSIEIVEGLIEGQKVYHISNSKSLTEYMMSSGSME